MPALQLFSYIFTLVGLLVIIFFVGLKNSESKLNRYFILFGLSVFLYSLSTFVSEFTPSLQSALVITQVAVFFANFIPYFFMRFTLVFSNSYDRNKLFAIIATAALPILSIVAFLPTTIGSVERTVFGTALSEVGPTLWLTLIYFVWLFGFSFRNLHVYARDSDAKVRSQVNLMVYGIGFSVAINMVVQIILPTFGVNDLGDTVGHPVNVILVGAVGLAILRHKMFDIKAVIFRSIGFVATITVVLFVYGLVVVAAKNTLFVNIEDSRYGDIFFVSVALLLALTVRPLVSLIQKQTDKLFFHNDYDPQELLNGLGKILASVIDLSVLTEKVSFLLKENMRIKTVNIVVLENNKVYHESAATVGADRDEMIKALETFEAGVYSKDTLAIGTQKSILESYNISVVSTLVTNNQRIGYILFYDRSSGVGYRSKDIKLIEIVTDELAIAIHNSLSYSLVQQFNAILQKRVEEATQQLKSVNEQLKEADAVKDDFITMTSHQLTTPLTAIDGYLSNATKGYYGRIQDELQAPLQSALSRARVMKQLVVDLLTVSRMSAGKFTLDLAPSDLNALVDIEVREFMARLNDRQKLTYYPPQQPIPSVYVDAQKLRQVIINLIDNALNYTPEGEVSVFLERDNDWLYYRVVDSGIGVPEPEKPKLFTKFYRASNAKTERPDGTGIGLYLVKRVIDTHGGEILFESTANKGSTFGFKIPLNKIAVPTSLSDIQS